MIPIAAVAACHVSTSECRRFHLLNKSNWMGDVGMSLVNAILLAGLPLAFVAIIIKAF